MTEINDNTVSQNQQVSETDVPEADTEKVEAENTSDTVPEEKKSKKTNIACLIAVAVIYTVIIILNAVQTNRPEYSDSENRYLSKMPEFSVASLTDGSFFKDFTSFISDTFWNREYFVEASKKMDTLRGITLKLGGKDFAVIGDADLETEDDEDDINELIEKLKELSSTDSETTVPDETSAEEKTPEETTEDIPEETSSEETSAEETTAPVEFRITSIVLSSPALRITELGSVVLSYTVNFEGEEEPYEVKFAVKDTTIAEAKKLGKDISIEGLKIGKTELTVTAGDVSAVCTVEVFKPEIEVVDDLEDGEYEFLKGGIFLYNDAAYLQATYSKGVTQLFSACADTYADLFPDTRISVIPAPLSSVVIDEPSIVKKIHNQGKALNSMEKYFSDKVNFVNIYETIYSHRKEYLYFRTDHHWTQRGAYYAYYDFMKSIGYEPESLDNMTYRVNTTNYHGSMYRYTKDPRVKNFSDSIETWNPGRTLKMVVTPSNASTYTKKSVVSTKKTYLCFIGGDNPYTEITVEGNDPNMNIIVFKDSYGNAFVPYLTCHYSKIIVIDPRYCKMTVQQIMENTGITFSDIIFVTNIQSANMKTWVNYFSRAIGVK